MPAQADRPALGDEHLHRRRQHPAQADVRDPRRLDQPPAERLEIDAQDARAAQVVDERLHLAARQPDVAVHADAADPEQRRREREGDALVDAEHEQQHAEHPARDRPRQARPESPASRRLRRRAPEVALGRRLDCHVEPPEPSPLGERRQDSVADAADRAGAERDHQVAGPARGRRRAPAGRRDPARREADTGRRGADRVGERCRRDARDRRLAGRVDVGEHDLVGGAERRAELREQIARAGVAVRLEHDHQPPAGRARRGDHRGDLGRDDGRSRRRPSRRGARRAPGSAARRR